MKVAVLNNAVPFVRGGAELLAEWLTDRLRRAGHDATLIRIPFCWDPPERILDSMLACRLLSLRNTDRVIAFKFPAFLVEHDNKVLWLLHQFRQAYDLWGTPLQFLESTGQGLEIRDIIRRTDTALMPKSRRIYTNSEVTSNRLMHFNGIASEVLYPPLQSPEEYRCDAYEDYIFCPSRMNDAKRQRLLVESMAHTKTPVRLLIAGRPEDPAYLQGIQAVIKRHSLQKKVTVMPEFISDATKYELFSRALGCAYIPYDEDSYGYVTMEAFQSRKPVITCTDSGGIDILVRNGETGWIVPPDAKALADAMDRFYLSPKRTAEMGEAGLALMESMGITWDNVISRLTA